MADIRASMNSLVSPVGTPGGGLSNRGVDKAGGPSFKETLGELSKATPTSADLAAKALKFSNHAVERMRTRGISYSPEQMQSLERAIDKAASKGAKETLVLANDSALIVSVNNRTVVTVMDKAALKENVFTNIDSTVVL